MKTIGGTGKTVMNIYGRNESQGAKGNSLIGSDEPVIVQLWWNNSRNLKSNASEQGARR